MSRGLQSKVSVSKILSLIQVPEGAVLHLKK